MNDFLQSLRNGTLKRQDRNRKNYDKPQYRNGERGGNRDKRSGNMNKPFGTPELGEIKALLQSMSDNTELTRIAQERSAEALERIARSLQALANGGSDLQPHQPLPLPIIAAPQESAATAPSIAPDTADQQAAGAPEHADDRSGTVATICAMRADGSSFEAIARQLNTQGVPTFSGKGEWRAQNVSRAYNSACPED